MQAELAVAVLAEHGAEYLETWRVPQLTWAELQALKAAHETEQAAIEGSPAAGAACSMHVGFSLVPEPLRPQAAAEIVMLVKIGGFAVRCCVQGATRCLDKAPWHPLQRRMLPHRTAACPTLLRRTG